MTNFVWDLQMFAATELTLAGAISTANGGSSFANSSGDWKTTWSASGTDYAGYKSGTLYAGTYANGLNITAGNRGFTLTAGTKGGNADVDAFLTGGGTNGNITVDGAAVSLEGAFMTFASGAATAIDAGTVVFHDGSLNVNGLTLTATASSSFVVGTHGTNDDSIMGSFTGTFKKEDSDVYSFTASGSSSIYLQGNKNAFTVTGSTADDIVVGGTQASSTLLGGSGKDSIWVSYGTSYVDGGAGDDYIAFDTANVAAGTTNKNGVTILGGAGADTINLTTASAGSLAYINGDDGADSINASATGLTFSTINGGKGNDYILAGGTSNSFFGGEGADTLVAGAGKGNTLYGGNGKDVFNFTAAGTAVIADYTLSDDLVLVNSTTVLTNAIAGTSFTAAGEFTVGGGVATVNNSLGYFAVNFEEATANKKQVVAWAGSDAANIDASSMTTGAVILGNTNDTVADTLIGSKNADTIYAGANDTVYGGAGADTINITSGATGVVIGSSTNGGNDSVTGFTAGFDTEYADSILLMDGSAGDLAVSVTGAGGASGDVIFKNGNGSLVLEKVSLTNGVANLNVSGIKLDVSAANGTITVDSSSVADAYYGTKASALSFAAVDDGDVNVDLRDTNKYRNMTTVRGGQVNTTIIGSAAKETLYATGGNTTLYGGEGNDSLVGAPTGKTVFALMAGGGNDSVSGFTAYTEDNADNASVVNTFGSAIASADYTSGKGVKLTTADGASMLLQDLTNDSIVAYTDNTSDVKYAKVGSSSKDNNFTYDSAVNVYIGGSKKDTLTVSDDNNHDIWLNSAEGTDGVVFNGIDVVNASASTGTLLLAGDAGSQSMVGGSGNTTLWGGNGVGVSDTLKAGSGTTTFFYGYSEGNDVLQNVKEEDTVYLFTLNLDNLQDASKAIETTGKITLTTTTGDSLTINRASGATVAHIMTADGSKYTATYATKTWSQGW